LVVLKSLFTTLTISAGLLVRTLVKSSTASTQGFDSHNVLLFWAYPTALGYEGAKEIQILRGTAAPIQSDARGGAGQHGQAPTDAGRSTGRLVHSRESESAGDQAVTPVMSPLRLFRNDADSTSCGTRLFGQRQRWLSESRGGGSQIRRQSLRSGESLGKLTALGDVPGQVSRIVGVIRENRYYSLRQDSSVPSEQVYLPFTQGRAICSARCASPFAQLLNHERSSAVRRVMQTVDQNLPVVSAGTQDDEVQDSIRQERSLALLLGVFAASLFYWLASVCMASCHTWSRAARARNRHPYGARRATLGRGRASHARKHGYRDIRRRY